MTNMLGCVLLLVLLPATVLGKPTQDRRAGSGHGYPYLKCFGSSFSTSDINGCLLRLYPTYEMQMQKAVEQLLSKTKGAWFPDVDEKVRQSVVEAQQAWEAFRDKQCQLEGDIVQGTMDTQIVLLCKIKLAEQRTIVLWRLAHSPFF